MAEDEAHDVVTGDGDAVGTIDTLAKGGGPRTIRPAPGVGGDGDRPASAAAG